MKKCRNILAEVRKRAGLTLKQLSEKSGVPVSTINNFEIGRRGINDEQMKKVLHVLQRTKGEIVEAVKVVPVIEQDGDRSPAERLDEMERRVGRIETVLVDILSRGGSLKATKV